MQQEVLVRLFSSFPCVSALLSLSTVFTPVSLRTVCSLKPRGKLLVFHLRRTQIAAGATPTFHSLSLPPSSIHSFIHFPESNYLWKEASSIHSQIERFIYSISINSLTKSNNHNYCTSHFGCKVINTQKRTR